MYIYIYMYVICIYIYKIILYILHVCNKNMYENWNPHVCGISYNESCIKCLHKEYLGYNLAREICHKYLDP
jgi:hypothetical protein